MLAAEIEPIRAKALPLVEVPAIALRIAAAFADPMHDSLRTVWIRPGVDEGEVIVSAASAPRMVEIACQGSCQRSVGLSVTALRNTIRRHKDAQHAVIVPNEIGLSLRTFSADCTVALQMAEVEGTPTPMQSAPAGQFVSDPFHFDTRLLIDVLRSIEGAQTVAIHPFSLGWSIQTKSEDCHVIAVVAGVVP